MRRLAAFFTLLTLLFTLTASSETSAPDLTGHWQTSQEETLCATVLTLTPAGRFYLTSEGVTYIGTWTQEGDKLLLSGASRAPYMPDASNVPFSVAYAYDSASGALDVGSGLHLYRILPDMEGIWLYFPETYSGLVGLVLSESKFHLTYTDLSDERIPPLPDGGSWFEGTWWLGGTWTQEGSILTLHAENGCVYTFTQDLTTGLLFSEDGYRSTAMTDSVSPPLRRGLFHARQTQRFVGAAISRPPCRTAAYTQRTHLIPKEVYLLHLVGFSL